VCGCAEAGENQSQDFAFASRVSAEIDMGAQVLPDGPAVPGPRAGRPRRFFSIQYLRALAALGVVVFHTLEASPHRFVLGAAGVDLFFVISGFIMWTVSTRERQPAVFLWRRIWRVVPTYWIATLLVAAVAVVRPHFLWQTEPSGGHLLLSLLFVPHFDTYGRLYPLLLQGWTLNYEMFFYAVFTVILFLPRQRQLVALIGAMAALAATGLALAPTSAVAHTYSDPLLLEFAAGAGLATLRERGWLANGPAGALLVLAGAVLLAASGGVDLQTDPMRWFYWGGPAAMIVAGAICVEEAGWVRNIPLLSLLGDASYSIYLFQVLALSLAARVLSGAPLWMSAPVSLAFACFVGVAAYRIVERPLGRMRGSLRQWFTARTQTLPGSEPGAAQPVMRKT
jgi:exopolysaccharide production protein ExoZ